MHRTLGMVVLLLLIAGPAAAYTVYLKDGTTIVATEKYRVDGRRAIIKLPSGTETFIAFEEIDVARTERANQSNYGDARVVGEDGSVSAVKTDEPEPEAKPTLTELAARQSASRPTQQRRPSVEPPATLPRTASGAIDLDALPRRPFHDLELASSVSRFFAGQSVEGLGLYQGSEPTTLLIEVTTNSEAAVFNALKIAANALVSVREKRGNALGAIELTCSNQRRQRAGQFTLTPELARELASGETDLPTFFVRHVQF